MKPAITIALLLLVFAVSCKKDPAPEPPVLSSGKDITDFSFAPADNTPYLAVGYKGHITNDTIRFTLPAGTSVEHLVPTVMITGTSVTPGSGTAQNFSSPVSYTVTAEDKTTKKYTVIVDVQAADAFASIYTAGVDKSKGEGHVYKIDANDGTVLWSAKTSASVSATPIRSGDNVLVADSNVLRALDELTGKEVWRYETGAAIHSIPTLYNGSLYFQNEDMMLYALQVANGVLRWKVSEGARQSGNTASPLLTGFVYAACSNGHLLAFDTSGHLLWDYQNPNGKGFTVRPAYAAVRLYTGDGALQLLNISADHGTLDESYALPAMINTCTENYSYVIYTGSVNGNVYSFDIFGLRDSFNTGAPVLESVTVAGQTIYANAGSKLYSLDDGLKSASWVYDNGDLIETSPVYTGLNNGLVFIASRGMVTAVSTSFKGQKAWTMHTLSADEDMSAGISYTTKGSDFTFPTESGNYLLNRK